MYYDLKISSSDVDLEAIITKAVNYNYSHIAIDVLINLHDDIDKLFIEHRSLIVKAKKLAENFNLKILSRATVVSSNKMDKNRMDLLKGFDIIAMIPISQKSLEDATHNLEIDIITFDSNSFCQLKLGSAIDVAIKRKIYIELDYSAAINGDSDAKSFIISSGAKNINHIRPPFDVINLGILCGLSHKNSVRALTRNPESLQSCGDKSLRKSKVASCFIFLPQLSFSSPFPTFFLLGLDVQNLTGLFRDRLHGPSSAPIAGASSSVGVSPTKCHAKPLPSSDA
ncbi:hypothetical protein HZS_6931, partial [Henneguya salminicola]